jgi:two-component system, NarL family, response regulator NreC
MASQVTIALAQDRRRSREGVRRLLEGAGYVVTGAVSDGREVLPMVQRLKPNVLVMDLIMPGLGGLEVTAEVARTSPATRVIILSTTHEDVFVLEALRNGAAGFVTWGEGGAELVRAVRDVATGRHFLSPPLSEVVIEAYLGGVTSAGDSYGSLTRREREVLHLVAEGMSAKETAKRLGMSPRTVETHRAHLMHKLGLHGRSELIRFAVQRGIVPPGLGQRSA